MTRLTTVAILGTVIGSSVVSPLEAQRSSPLFGSLEPGRYAVGFTTKVYRDSTRFDLPKINTIGKPEIADRSRQLTVHIWYPAAASTARAMTVADYMVSHFADTASDATRRAQDANIRKFLADWGAISDSAWTAFRAAPLLARRNVAAATGRFPLIVGELRPFSTTITNEYLASHGYVIAMVRGMSPDIPDPGAGLEIALRDMEFIVPEMRKRQDVDPGKLAALGFSGSGFSQILFAMRHPDVDAVSDLESAIFTNSVFWPLSGGWGYDVAALRVPFLHLYSVPLSRGDNRFADFEAMRYSQRHHYLVDAPGIHHWDFATEGMAASTVLRNRGENGPRLRQAFETTNRYLLAFFNAYVKRDSTELAFLRRDPAANGAPPGLATIRELPAVRPAPSTADFEKLIADRGIDSALVVFGNARREDPAASLFEERRLNSTAYRLLRREKRVEAIAMFRTILRLYPNSANAHDSLAEVLEAAGDRAESLAVTRKGLEALERDQLPAERKAQLRTLLEARAKRLAP